MDVFTSYNNPDLYEGGNEGVFAWHFMVLRHSYGASVLIGN